MARPTSKSSAEVRARLAAERKAKDDAARQAAKNRKAPPGKLAPRPSSAITTKPQPKPQPNNVRGSGVRTGQPGAPVRGALPPAKGGPLATRPSTAITTKPTSRPTGDSVRGGGVRTGQPGPTRPALPAAVTKGVTAAGRLGRLPGPVAAALQLPDAIKDAFVTQPRRTKAAFDKMVATAPGSGSAGPKGTGTNSNPRPGRVSNLGPNYRGEELRLAAAANASQVKPTPSKPSAKPPGRPSTAPAPTSSPEGQSRRLAAASRPSSVASASDPKTPGTAAKPSGDSSSTDSWSVNFLRQKRGLASLAKAKPPSESSVGPVKDGAAYGKSIETKGIGPVKDGANYAMQIGTKGTGPVKDGSSYADSLKKRKKK